MQLSRTRLAELSTMDDDLYDRQMQDGRITRAENAACIEVMKANCERLEKQNARTRRENDERQEVERRYLIELQERSFDLEMQISTLEDEIRRNTKRRDESLIDYGVEAVKRGEDPIEAMREKRKECALWQALIRNGYLSVDVQSGEVVSCRWTAKGRKLAARLRVAGY